MLKTTNYCFNTIKNEYPELGGDYEVMHHTEFLQKLVAEGKLTIEGGTYKGKRITFHDPCYLGRANGIFQAPRDLIAKLDAARQRLAKATGQVPKLTLCYEAGYDGFGWRGSSSTMGSVAWSWIRASHGTTWTSS